MENTGKTRDEIAEAYSSPPWWYDIRGFFILTFAYNSTIWAQLRFFAPNFGNNHLEVACGTGTLLEMILRWRKYKKMPTSNIVGIDYAESMLAGAIKRFKDNPDVTLKHADAAELPYPDNFFDTANIANSIHCFPSIEGSLKDILRVLKPGGTLACNVLLYPRTPWPFNRIAQRINDWGIKKGILYTPYHKDELKDKLLEAGYEVTYENISGNCYDVVCRKPQ
ncbi:SAM-dependent methyltransferase [Hahella sp. CCB-MM4]|uniref:class I SAM-dependent methyltransferase n=1 Tax=Hahella sp. (strain CCB-MM4) TaxID=1926491 RepID=UPI000B9C1492|nr:methyltransferase domain-containing protein [Hahella sp. CCB-MM4]OZG73414.1 SAM-dependent methyltransferase [Hahella sp. CCB-MM4]